MTRPPTFRELADACCNQCRQMYGDGPWCPYCGADMPDAATYDGTWFASAMCDLCDEKYA